MLLSGRLYRYVPQVLSLALALAVCAGLIVLVCRDPNRGIAVLLAGFLASSYARPLTSDWSVQVGNFSLYSIDLALLVVFAAWAIRRMGGEDSSRLPRPLLFLLGLLVIHTLRGVHTYGAQVAINGDRRWWWFLGAALYATSVRWGPELNRCFMLAGFALLGMALYGFATTGIQNASRLVYVNGEFLTLRPLSAAGALLLLQIAIVLFLVPWPRRWLKTVFLVAAGPVIVLLQHRTVWVAAVVAAPWLYVSWLRKIHREASYAVFGVSLLATPLIVWTLTSSHALASSVKTTSGSHSTFQWRIDSWRQLLNGLSPSGWLWGEPAGHPFNRYIAGQLINVQPHNLYVETILRFGLIGLAALLVYWFAAWRRLRDAELLPWPRWVGYTVLASEGVFGVAYMLNIADGMWLGLFTAASFGLADRRAIRPVVPV